MGLLLFGIPLKRDQARTGQQFDAEKSSVFSEGTLKTPNARAAVVSRTFIHDFESFTENWLHISESVRKA